MYLSLSLYLSLSIYIYIYRERERYMYIYIYLYIYIYIYIERERERETYRYARERPVRHDSLIGRGDDTVGNPPRAQICQFEFFELILLLELNIRFPVERFEATASQSAVPSPPLTPRRFGGSRRLPRGLRGNQTKQAKQTAKQTQTRNTQN